jgi:hypothetical protein
VLALAALVVTTAIVLDQFPEMTSELLARVADRGGHGAVGHDMKDMGGKVAQMRPGILWVVLLFLLLLVHVALAAPSTVVLSIEGMT